MKQILLLLLLSFLKSLKVDADNQCCCCFSCCCFSCCCLSCCSSCCCGCSSSSSSSFCCCCRGFFHLSLGWIVSARSTLQQTESCTANTSSLLLFVSPNLASFCSFSQQISFRMQLLKCERTPTAVSLKPQTPQQLSSLSPHARKNSPPSFQLSAKKQIENTSLSHTQTCAFTKNIL